MYTQFCLKAKKKDRVFFFLKVGITFLTLFVSVYLVYGQKQVIKINDSVAFYNHGFI